MSTAQLIIKFIDEHPVEEFLSRQALIKFGTARAVDAVIKRLLDKGIIIREIRGLYYKRERTRKTTVEEVATAKAKAFGRKIFSDAANLAHKFGIAAKPETPGPRFATDARTSSFDFHGVPITLKGTSPKKVKLGDSAPGKIIRALCSIGKNEISHEIVSRVTSGLSFREMVAIADLGNLMPAWLNEFFYTWNLLEHGERPKPHRNENGESRNMVSEKPLSYLSGDYVIDSISFLHPQSECAEWYQHEVKQE